MGDRRLRDRSNLLEVIPVMVDERRLERKLPAALVDGPATSREGIIDYKRKERAIQKLKRKNPQRFRTLLFNYFQAVAAFDREITEQARREIDDFNRGVKRGPGQPKTNA